MHTYLLTLVHASSYMWTHTFTHTLTPMHVPWLGVQAFWMSFPPFWGAHISEKELENLEQTGLRNEGRLYVQLCFVFFPDSRVRLKGFCLFVIKSCRLKSIILLKWTQPKDSRAGSCRRSHRGPHYPLSSRSGSTRPSAFKTLNPESPSDIVSGYIQENGLRWVKG